MSLTSDYSEDVVMVDDDELTVELVERRLRKTDFKLTSFTNNVKALAFLHDHAARVLIVDYRMPGIDGLNLLEKLAMGKGILAERTYLCSAGTLPATVQSRAKRLGVRVLQKDVLRNKAQFLKLLEPVNADSTKRGPNISANLQHSSPLRSP